jgi:signal transduction histidine kinase
VEVVVSVTSDALVVRVSDNGVGIGDHVSPGRGLRNITERAAQVAGNCVATNGEGGGAVITWTAKRLD